MSTTVPGRAARGLETALLVGLYAVPLTVPWTVAGAHLAVGLASAAGIGLGLATRRWPVRRTLADGAMLAFAIACVLATLTAADRFASFLALKKLLLVPVVHLAAATLATPRRSRLALRLFVAALTVAGLAATLHHLFVPHAPGERLRLVGHYMTFAGLLLLALPLAATAAATSRGRVRAGYAAATFVLAATLLLGYTRGAWLGAMAGAAAIVLRARPRLVWAVPLVAALGLAALPAAYRERALSSFDTQHPLNAERLGLWRAGLGIWRAHPWTGVGLVDLGPYTAGSGPAGSQRVYGHLHDNGLQILATTGGIGLMAFLWLMVGFGRLAAAAGAACPDGERRGLGLGIWGSFWGFQTMGLFEWNFGDVEVTIALYFLLGAALAAGVAAASPGASPAAGTLGPRAPAGGGWVSS